MVNYLKITIPTLSDEVQEILMAELNELGFYAFEQEENSLLAYIKPEDFTEDLLSKNLPYLEDFQVTFIEDENWNRQWEENLQPVIIGNFAAIRALFHAPITNVEHELIITPKMSFGTGHHATTFIMIQMMERVDFKNKSVIDFGTGTGVLAILSEKLGATNILGIDYDEWSVENAQENIAANDCRYISISQMNELPVTDSVDILLANINLNVLATASGSIARLMKQPGLLLVSGFLQADEPAIENIFAGNQFVKRFVLEKDGWLAIMFEKK
jgi:ribosomal protein L11 methyltransferase